MVKNYFGDLPALKTVQPSYNIHKIRVANIPSITNKSRLFPTKDWAFTARDVSVVTVMKMKGMISGKTGLCFFQN